MEKQIIWRGVLAGALAGVIAFVFARILLEPVISRAIGYEEGRSDVESATISGAHDHHHEIELFSRGVQANVGMGFGVLGFGVAMGALFAVAFIVVYTRTKSLSARALALVMAAAAFVSVYLVPYLKYPANPPSVGDADTIGVRTTLYLLMVGLSLSFAACAVWLARTLARRLGTWEAALSGIGLYIAAIAVTMLVLPAVSEVPRPLTDATGTIRYPGFPADDLFEFRLYAVGTQLLLWVTIGLVFGRLVSRLLTESPRQPAGV
jgi:hypothetical protein